MFFASPTFVTIHVAISLIGIAAGLIALFGMLANRAMAGFTALFLIATLATSVTGFLFPIGGFTPALATGVLSCVILVPTFAALYGFHLAGIWRLVYVFGAVAALYLNCFVLVVQGFLKVPALNALAPNGNDPPFVIAQGVVLLAFIVAGLFAYKRFRPHP